VLVVVPSGETVGFLEILRLGGTYGITENRRKTSGILLDCFGNIWH